MNTAILIASRELRDRSRLFLIAAAMAVVPFCAALAVRQNRSLAIASLAAFLAIAYSSALALALGVSSVGREMTERRLSFFFAKPVSAGAIWAGKVASALATIFGALFIILMPAYVFAHGAWSSMWPASGRQIVLYAAAAGTALFFVGHVLSTMVRSRSGRVALDFALLVITSILLFAMLRPILLGGGMDVVLRIIAAASAAILLILAIAPVWQLSRGRVDARENHATLSTAIWMGVAVVLIAVAGYSYWVISPSLDSIADRFALEQSQSGRWVYLSGQAPGRGSYFASFLVDTATGEQERVPLSAWGNIHFSADGKTLAWMEPEQWLPTVSAFRLHTRRLEPGAKQITTPIVGSMAWAAALTDDGSRIAMVRNRQVEVFDIASGRLLGAAKGITNGQIAGIMFATPELVRIAERTSKVLYVREFDLAHRKFRTTIERPVEMGYFGLQFSADGSRVFLRHNGTTLDANSGQTIGTLPVAPARAFFSTMLRDGSTVVTRDSKLYHFDRDNNVVAEIALPVKQAGVAGEVGASKILLAVAGNDPSKWRMLVVDLANRKVERDVANVLGPVSTWAELVLPRFADDATFVAMDSARKVVLWDARSGAKRPFPS